MSNILFINLFYAIGPGAMSTSVFILLALLFLAWVDSARLKAAFWDVVDRLAPIRLGHDWVKHGVRLLPYTLVQEMLNLAITYLRLALGAMPLHSSRFFRCITPARADGPIHLS